MKYVCTVISVADIKAARKFYEDLFSLEVYQDYGRNTDDNTQHGQKGSAPVHPDVADRHFHIFPKLCHPSALHRSHLGAFRKAHTVVQYDLLRSVETFSDLHKIHGRDPGHHIPDCQDSVFHDIDKTSVPAHID